jgi:hypothetical protein
MNVLTDRQTEKTTFRQTDIYREIGRQANRLAGIHAYMQINREGDRVTGR